MSYSTNKKKSLTSAEFHQKLLFQKPQYSVRHHGLQMFTEIATPWISTYKDAFYSAQEIEALSEEWLLITLITLNRFDNGKITGLGYLKKHNTAPFPVSVSETSSRQTRLAVDPLF